MCAQGELPPISCLLFAILCAPRNFRKIGTRFEGRPHQTRRGGSNMAADRCLTWWRLKNATTMRPPLLLFGPGAQLWMGSGWALGEFWTSFRLGLDGLEANWGPSCIGDTIRLAGGDWRKRGRRVCVFVCGPEVSTGPQD